ncbi:uncharacterized protein LOC126894275 isoform X2 [Daktulosphaira vitifoliae]|uniref:uncharacterized protein LOC126894275 isoform X2 n=1 Tax=Daktulosphaira vitifoliae TaxID=58002 RepID=UPI0021AA04EB|nr:uncharacterized protein LOC126894275 isoform X2 [Daktulosphaira vitifoliae]
MKNCYFFLLLFIFILLTETTRNSKRITNIYSCLVQNDGWKDLKDVKCVEYRKEFYKLENYLEATTKENCNKGIRILTLVLACSYAKDLKILYFLIMPIVQHCKSLINQKDQLKTCTMELLNILQKMPSLATLMKETLNVLNYMHTYSWKNFFFFNNLFRNLEIFNNKLKNYPIVENDSSAMEKFYNFIESTFNYKNVKNEFNSLTYCEFESFNMAAFWQECSKEYNHKFNSDKTFQLYDYLIQKIHILINSIIINRFHKLGFKYCRKVFQIGISVPYKYNTDEMEYQWILKLIDSLNEEQGNVSDTNKELQFIDFLGQGLDPSSSNENISEPMETDENRESYTKYF